MTKYLFFAGCLILLMLNACTPDYLYQEEKTIASGNWAYTDTLDFKFKVQDTTVHYDIAVDFTYSDTFPNQNIYVKFYTRFPDGKRLSKPLSFDLFNALGAPAGKCSGENCEAHILIQQNAYFNQPGEYVITLEQFGRRNPVGGVQKIGLSIQPSPKQKK